MRKAAPVSNREIVSAEVETQRNRQVVDHVRALIESGALKPGDRIPPEREFARQLGISRASLRTGIGYLAAMGVMKIRHGVGTFVADGPPALGEASLSFLGALHGFQAWQLFEARMLLEGNLAALAAERGTEPDHAALADEVTEMFATLDDPESHLLHDMIFHRRVAQASGNPILAAVMETLTASMYGRRRRTVERSPNLRESAEAHRSIYRAIRAHQPEEARRLMEEHLRAAREADERDELAAAQA